MFQGGPPSTARDRDAVVLGARDFTNPGNFPYGKWVAQVRVSLKSTPERKRGWPQEARLRTQ